MLRNFLRSAVQARGIIGKKCQKLQPASCRRLAPAFHTCTSIHKATDINTYADPQSHFEGICKRGFYLDDIYQHIKGYQVEEMNIVEDGKHVEIKWKDGHVSRFHSMWLRHNCHCAQCLPYTTTVLVDFSKIDDDIRVTSATVDDDNVIVLTWRGETGETFHEGPILTKFLRYHCYSEAAINERKEQRAMRFSDDKTVPEVDCDDVMGSDEGLYKWLLALSEKGICLIKNMPDRRGAIREVAERISLIQPTIYGDIFDVESDPDPNPMNAAYTGLGLDLHMDQIHYESPPGLQMLHCVEFDDIIKGGENLFVDLHEVAHKFRKEHPDFFMTLTRVPSAANTVDYSRDDPAHVRIQRPLITINHLDEIVSVLWQPMSIAPLVVPEKDIEPFYKAYKVFYTMVHYHKSMYEHLLRPGDMITLNNRRVLHGRKEFRGNGRRLLQGCYINISEFQSKVQMFHNKYGGGRWPVRSGSIDWQ